jgi:hypothetical protein
LFYWNCTMFSFISSFAVCCTNQFWIFIVVDERNENCEWTLQRRHRLEPIRSSISPRVRLLTSSSNVHTFASTLLGLWFFLHAPFIFLYFYMYKSSSLGHPVLCLNSEGVFVWVSVCVCVCVCACVCVCVCVNLFVSVCVFVMLFVFSSLFCRIYACFDISIIVL